MKSEYEGSWWLPEKSDVKVHGSLRVRSDGRLSLDLTGTLIESREFALQAIPVILGCSIDREFFTLYGCIQNETRFSGEGVRASSFDIVGILIGAYFQGSDDLVFGRLEVTFPQLQDWVGERGVSIAPPNGETLVITKKTSSLASARVRDGKLSLGFRLSEHYGSGEFSVKYVPYVSIEMAKEVPLRKAFEFLYHLRNFFALAVSHPVYPDLIDGFTETAKVSLSDGKSFRRPIKIVYTGMNYGVPLDSVNRRGMLFELSSVRSQFANLLEKWFEKRDLLEPVYDLYFGTLYNTQLFLQQKFLSLIQGVESYHRRVFDGYESPSEEHKKRLQEIIKAVPDEYKNWLQDKLSDSNDLSLKKRLEELVKKYSFLGFEAEFVDKVRNARNYLTHFDENKKEYAKPDELFIHTRKLRALTESILLTELGLTLTEVEAMMTPIEKRRAEEFRIYDF